VFAGLPPGQRDLERATPHPHPPPPLHSGKASPSFSLPEREGAAL